MKVRRVVEVEAIQWTGTNVAEVEDFCREPDGPAPLRMWMYLATPSVENGLWSATELWISTPEGRRLAQAGDWIVREKDGFHLLRPDVFARAYEPTADRPAGQPGWIARGRWFVGVLPDGLTTRVLVGFGVKTPGPAGVTVGLESAKLLPERRLAAAAVDQFGVLASSIEEALNEVEKGLRRALEPAVYRGEVPAARTGEVESAVIRGTPGAGEPWHVAPTADELADRVGTVLDRDSLCAKTLAARVRSVLAYCTEEKSSSEERRSLVRHIRRLLNGVPDDDLRPEPERPTRPSGAEWEWHPWYAEFQRDARRRIVIEEVATNNALEYDVYLTGIVESERRLMRHLTLDECIGYGAILLVSGRAAVAKTPEQEREWERKRAHAARAAAQGGLGGIGQGRA